MNNLLKNVGDFCLAGKVIAGQCNLIDFTVKPFLLGWKMSSQLWQPGVCLFSKRSLLSGSASLQKAGSIVILVVLSVPQTLPGNYYLNNHWFMLHKA